MTSTLFMGFMAVGLGATAYVELRYGDSIPFLAILASVGSLAAWVGSF